MAPVSTTGTAARYEARNITRSFFDLPRSGLVRRNPQRVGELPNHAEGLFSH